MQNNSDAGDDIILIPGTVGQSMGSKYDWQFKSVVQTAANGRVVNIPAGKLVGGGSALNGMCFDRGAAADYDAWADLGNPGWTFNELLPYFKRVGCDGVDRLC
jgi:choline dehydrogenase-like flavoprotein